MRAVMVERPGPPDVLRVTEVSEPIPGDGELSIDVEYAGVGFVDTLFRRGEFALPTPFTPGLEVTGRVRALGAGVTGFTAGQPVAALLNDFGRGPRAGGYAEVAVAHASMVTLVPAGSDLATVAAALVNGVTGWLALHDLARLRSGEDVLVLGASGGLGGTVSRLAALHPAGRDHRPGRR
jgi:NADPH2:quinone reductase